MKILEYLHYLLILYFNLNIIKINKFTINHSKNYLFQHPQILWVLGFNILGDLLIKNNYLNIL